MKRLSAILCSAVVISSGVGAQSVGLSFSSPTNGATISDGSIPISVQLAPNVNCGKILVIAEGIGLATLMAPFQGSIPLPSEYNGTTKLRALCTTTSNVAVSSPILSVIIDPGTTYTAIKVYPSSLHFSRAGQQVQMNVSAITSSGQNVTITQSPRVSYSSADSSIATVTNTGLTMAAGSGSTVIRVNVGGVEQDIKVSVPTSLSGDLNGDGQIDTDDINVLTSYLNTPASGPNDARDLNHDGKIDALDARILTTLCTYPRCATHP